MYPGWLLGGQSVSEGSRNGNSAVVRCSLNLCPIVRCPMVRYPLVRYPIVQWKMVSIKIFQLFKYYFLAI